jgi:hypothetical protein
MTHNHIVIILFLLLFCVNPALSTNITGRVYDNETKEYLPYTSVLLLKVDSTFIAGATTDSEGKFIIRGNFPIDDYLLKIIMLSYYDYFVELRHLDSDIRLDSIFLKPKSADLKEIVVNSQSIIYESNNQTYVPTISQKKLATNGIDLLNSIMIKGISVDIVSESITKLSGGNIQFSINGRNVSLLELKSINPNDVLRVEYYDYPYRKYTYDDQSVAGVINVIVKKAESGGYFATNTQTAITTGFGNEQIVSKMNYKNSEISFMYGLNFRDYNERRVNIEENYQLPSISIKRNLEGINAPYKYQIHDIEIAYNIQSQDKWLFNATIKDNITNRHNELKQHISYFNTYRDSFFVASDAKTLQHIPSIDLYGQIKINEGENLYLNIVGSYFRTKFQQQYINYNLIDTLFSIATYVDGQKKSMIGEGIYEKNIGKHVLMYGIKYTFNSSKNNYEQFAAKLTKMEQSSVYSFISVSKLKRFAYEISIGASGIFNKQNENKRVTYYYFQPSLYLGYKINSAFNLKYYFYLTPIIPTLSQLSNVIQRVDDVWMQKGNSELKPYNEYEQSLSVYYDKNNLSTEINARHNFQYKPIMEDVLYDSDNNYFIRFPSNQKKYQQYKLSITSTYKFMKDFARIWVNISYSHEESIGNAYKHYYNNLFSGLQLSLNYKNIRLSCTRSLSRINSLYGEEIIRNEKNTIVELNYKIKSFSLGMGVLNPFSHTWRTGTDYLSDIYFSKTRSYINDGLNMVYLRLSYNLSYGHKYNVKQKELYNTDSDPGIMSIEKK